MLLKAIIKKYIQYFHSKKWRKHNTHNETYATSKFPIDVVSVGNFSYGPLNVSCWKADNEKLIIGNFVSIAEGVKFLLGGNHNIHTLSTFPFKVKYLGEEKEAWSKGTIVIEDDVWIGTNALILSGVKIGKGSIIAAGSIVTKNVPPYAIIGGNPGKIIKYRFEKELRDHLLDFDFTKINNEFVSKNIENLYRNLDLETLSYLKVAAKKVKQVKSL